MILECHIVWYSEYNKFFLSSQSLYNSISSVYSAICFGRKGPSSGYLHTLFTSISLRVLLLLLHWPMFTLMEVEVLFVLWCLFSLMMYY
jgi:hypothetical protein